MQADIKSAYLYAPKSEEIFMHQPQGYIVIQTKTGLGMQIRQDLVWSPSKQKTLVLQINDILLDISFKKFD